MSFAKSHNIGALIKVLRAAANTAVTAAGAGDNTVVTGVTLDRSLYNMPLSAVIAIPFTTTLGASATLTLKNVVLEHGDASNLSDVATLQTLEDGTGTAIVTDSGSGSTTTGCKEYDVDLGAAKRYIRIKFTPDLSAANTDTAGLSAVVVTGGGDTVPI